MKSAVMLMAAGMKINGYEICPILIDPHEQLEEKKNLDILINDYIDVYNKVVGKADVDIMTQELNQTESQVAKDDLWNNALSISAIPNKQGNTGGDTQGAVELRNGWDFSKQRAKLKDPYIMEAEQALAERVLNIIRIRKGKNECPITTMDFDVQINHSPQDNMQVKAQTFQILIKNGIHPLIAIKTCGLWGDSEKTYLMSKPYLDVLYKTIDTVVEDAEEQEKKAKEIAEQLKKQSKQATGE